MERIAQLIQATIRAAGRPVELSRITHADGLMRPLLVVVLDEAIEAGLLLE